MSVVIALSAMQLAMAPTQAEFNWMFVHRDDRFLNIHISLDIYISPFEGEKNI